MTDYKYMTADECERKHRITKWLMSSILILCGFFVAMNGWSLMASQNATVRAAAAASDLAILATGQERDIKHLQSTVNELKIEVRALRNTLDRITRIPQFQNPGSALNQRSASVEN